MKGVTTTQTTIANAAKRANETGLTIPTILLHSFLLARRAVDRAKAAEKKMGDAIREYMVDEAVTTLESDEAKAALFTVKDRDGFDREGLQRDYPAIYAMYVKPATTTHTALRVTPKA